MASIQALLPYPATTQHYDWIGTLQCFRREVKIIEHTCIQNGIGAVPGENKVVIYALAAYRKPYSFKEFCESHFLPGVVSRSEWTLERV